jgi:late competence protein required for DNA uptake (superfamily II DNA/RNA helicase)
MRLTHLQNLKLSALPSPTKIVGFAVVKQKRGKCERAGKKNRFLVQSVASGSFYCVIVPFGDVCDQDCYVWRPYCQRFGLCRIFIT